jgi:hypothetical protein
MKNDISSQTNTVGLDDDRNTTKIRIDCSFMVDDN